MIRYRHNMHKEDAYRVVVVVDYGDGESGGKLGNRFSRIKL